MTTFLPRRKEGQSLAEMREKRDMEDAKLLAEERRRQKIEDQKARRAVLDKIKQDRFTLNSLVDDFLLPRAVCCTFVTHTHRGLLFEVSVYCLTVLEIILKNMFQFAL